MPDYKVQSCDCGYEPTAIGEVPRGLRRAAPCRLPWLVVFTAITALVLAATPAGAGTAGALVQPSSEPAADEICTIASIERRATVEVQVAHAEDFCELLAQALASSVFRTSLLVTPGVLWHYAGSDPSCQLRFGSTRHRMAVRNSVRTCRWLARHATGWRTDRAPGVAVSVTFA